MNIKDKMNMVIQLAEEMKDKMILRENTKDKNKKLTGDNRIFGAWENPEPKAGIIANGLKIRKLLVEIEKELK